MGDIPVYVVLSLPLVAAFAMFALGIVVIFQSSRVLNLAHGTMAMVPPYLLYELSRRGVALPIALALSVASGAALGAVVERFFVRALRRQGPTGQTVATVAALGVLVAVAVKVWGTTPRSGVDVFPSGGVHLSASVLSYGQIGLIVVAVAAAGVLALLFQRTEIGLALRATANNRRGAALMGINPDRTTQLAWMLGGALAAIAGILLAAVTTLHPYNLSLLVLPGFVAALIGNLTSLPGALVGAAVVGLAQGMVPAFDGIPGIGRIAHQVGAPELVVTVVAFVVMYVRGVRFGSAERDSTSGFDATTPAIRRAVVAPAAVRRVGVGVGCVVLVTWPHLGTPISWVGDAIQACVFLLVAVSIVMLTGWVGQISLAQATFVGIGAFATAQLSRHFGVVFPVSLPLAAAIAGATATMLGVVALRVRGLYLAVATLIFLWMSGEYLFSSSWLVGAGGSASIAVQRIGRRNTIPFFDFSDRRTLYYVAVAIAVTVLVAATNARDSRTGRAFFAIRGSEVAAASLGIDVTRYKLIAFAVSGVLAGTAGNLLIVTHGAAVPSEFGLNASLLYVAIAVVGGLGSLGGAVVASMLFALLNELFFRVSALAGWLDVVGAGLLAVVLLLRPGGLASLAPRWSTRVRIPKPGRTSATAARERRAIAAVHQASGLPDGGRGLPVVARVDRLVVRFGGLVAVDDVSLEVGQGEITGLIGPNGAGKTTIFGAVSGLVSASTGTVELFGRDVTPLAVHQRAALGLARTFQSVQLFAQLSAFENLMVATHLHHPAGLLSSVVMSRPAVLAEDDARRRVRDVVAYFGLTDVADRPVAGLPLGVLRMVELARAVVTGAPLVMLDEPASGLDTGETGHLASRLRALRDELGITIFLIEHDVSLVTTVSDYIYVLDQGKLLAAGAPADIQRQQSVRAAYLGTPASVRLPAGL